MHLLCSCGATLAYDEKKDAELDHVFVRKSVWMTHAVLMDQDLHMIFGAETFDAFWRVRRATYESNGDSFLAKKTFTDIFWNWISLCVMDTDHLFSCSICAQLPPEKSVWVWDGITIGIKNSKLDLSDLKNCESSPERKVKVG
jgi:hypothetical protein